MLTINAAGANTVLEMTRDFDTITEFALDSNEEGEGILVCYLDSAYTIDLIPLYPRCQPLCRLG